MVNIMKTIKLATIALASALLTGTAFASTVNNEIGGFGPGLNIETASHFSSKEDVVIGSTNLPRGHFGEDLYIGSK